MDRINTGRNLSSTVFTVCTISCRNGTEFYNLTVQCTYVSRDANKQLLNARKLLPASCL